MSKITYKSLCLEDLEQILAIENRIQKQSRRGFFEKRLTVAKADPDAFITCAAYNGETLRGFAFARIQYEAAFGSTQTMAVLDAFGVDPDAQGQGIAKSLLVGIENRMAQKSITTMRSEIEWSNHDLIRFFTATHFNLAPTQIVSRNISVLPETTQEQDAGATLSRDRVLIRSLKGADLNAVVRLDRDLTGRDHSAYYGKKFNEMLIESGICVSLVAEQKDMLAGFIMARVDYGEFGQPIQSAVIDSIGVHPAEARTGVGRALLSQLLINLSSLKIESLHTQIQWQQHDLHKFFQSCGFVPSQRLVLTKEIR